MYTKDAIRYSLNFADPVVMQPLETIKDAALTFPTPQGGCHPLWVVGHLAFVEGMAHEILGGGSNPVSDWAPMFGQETVPAADAARYPSFGEVRDKYVELRARNLQLLEGLAEADLDGATTWQPEGLEEHFASYGKTLLTLALHQAGHRAHITDAVRAAGAGKA